MAHEVGAIEQQTHLSSDKKDVQGPLGDAGSDTVDLEQKFG